MRITAILPAALVAFVSCGGDSAAGPTDEDPTVAAVSVSPSSRSLLVGDTVRFTAAVRDTEGRDVSAAVSWASDNPDAATVSSSGLVTAMGEGTAAIEARAGGVKGSAEVVVSSVATPAQSVEAIQSIVVESMPGVGVAAEGRDLAGELEALVPELLARPDVLTVILYREAATLQVTLKSGLTMVIVNNRPPRYDEGVPPALGLAAPPAAVSVPGATKAIVISIGGGASVATSVGGLLSAAGYSVSTITGTIDQMRGLKGVGAMYLDTHGAAFVPITFDVDATGLPVNLQVSNAVYSLETATIADGAMLASLESELESGDIVVKFTQSWTGAWDAKLGITESFILKNWSFRNGVVMLHACFSGAGRFTQGGQCFGSCPINSGYFDATPVRTAVLDAGADLVIGFDHSTWPTQAAPSILYLFDRALGTDMHPPATGQPVRPFDLGAIETGMFQRNLNFFNLGGHAVGVTFDYRVAKDEVTMLPTIESMDIVDDAAAPDGQLTLRGRFGTEVGTVEVDGRQANVTSWAQKLILARVPVAGGGNVGEVVVKNPAGLESNGVPLTEWIGTLKARVRSIGSQEAEAVIDVRFRADAHAFRQAVEEEAQHRMVKTYLSPASSGDVTGTGSFSQGGVTVSWMGSDPIEMLTKAEVDAGAVIQGTGRSVFGGFAMLDADAGTAKLCFSLVGRTLTEVSGLGPPTQQMSEVIILPQNLFDSIASGFPCLDLPLSQSYSMPSGQRSLNLGNVEIELEWSSFDPVSPPDMKTAG